MRQPSSIFNLFIHFFHLPILNNSKMVLLKMQRKDRPNQYQHHQKDWLQHHQKLVNQRIHPTWNRIDVAQTYVFLLFKYYTAKADANKKNTFVYFQAIMIPRAKYYSQQGPANVCPAEQIHQQNHERYVIINCIGFWQHIPIAKFIFQFFRSFCV